MRHARYFRLGVILIVAVGVILALGVMPVNADGPVVTTRGYASWIEGNQAVQPAKGKAGIGNKANWLPYFVPGQTTEGNNVVGQPYDIAYANQNQPVQSSDWWSGVGLQWQGWIIGVDKANPVIRTQAFFSEPFTYQFIDLPDSQTVEGLPLPVSGLRMWNAKDMRIYTGSENTATNLVGRGSIADQRSPVVTVGLKGVHPISDILPDVPAKAPWTNVKVQSYTDWGVVMSYASSGSQLDITMANGSPFTWFERTQGDAPFRVWAGGDTTDEGGSMSVWYNQDGVLGVTVGTAYVPPGPKIEPNPVSKAAYVIYADQGDWKEQKSTNSAAHMSLFQNNAAKKLVIAALPHNLNLGNTDGLVSALNDFQTYAWNRVVGTQIHFPPIEGSETSIKINKKCCTLGYDAENAVIRSMMAVTTDAFKGGSPGKTIQIVFPHQYKSMIPQSASNIPLVDGKPQYTWLSPKGELRAYIGNFYVRELKTYGLLPYLPSLAINSTDQVNGTLPAEDIYNSLKAWFYTEEPQSSGKTDGFIRNPGSYWPYQNNTYSPNIAAVFENIFIADELSRSSTLNAIDPDRGKPKKAVAAEIRNESLELLKEIIGRWADVYSVGYFQYNPDFDTIYGFPQGYGSVQTLSDKHFHWSYFMRSAAVIGRYDSEWLEAFKPLFDQMVLDVASYTRSGSRFPFMRNFSPFYGHSWANGLGNDGIGNDQESTSEAINFAAAMFELGQETGNKEWRDVALYLYEEQVLGTEQYWFNQDANLDASSGTYYNGNWPDAFVHFEHSGKQHITPIVGQVYQPFTSRGTFFGSPDFNSYPNSMLIQALPLSASHLYFGRDPVWLTKLWEEFIRLSQEHPGMTAYENILAGIQARVPGTGLGIDDPGPLGAIARVNRLHPIFQGAVNSQTKNWAYALNALGQLDINVVADIPAYGVFCKGGTGTNCQGGTRTFVAYNPAASAMTVSFYDVQNGGTLASFDVPQYTLATRVGSGTPTYDRSSTPTGKALRLFFRKPPGFSSDCGPLSENKILPLHSEAGTWKLPDGKTGYPQNAGALMDSIVCIPARPDTGGANVPPAKEYVRSWSGTFSGALVKNDVKPHTRFALYTDQSLFPGWEIDPCVSGGNGLPNNCQNNGLNPPNGPGGNAFTMQISYDFNADGKFERIEQYRNAALEAPNAFSYGNRQTDYRFDQIYPFANLSPMILGGPDGTKTAPFPDSIPANKPATIKVQLWGGTITGGVKAQFPVPFSVNAAQLTNRASWILPPYGPTE